MIMSEEEMFKLVNEMAKNEYHELGDCWNENKCQEALQMLLKKYKKIKKYITDEVKVENEIQTYVSQDFVEKNYINKDKIKEKLENYIISYNDIESNFETTAQQYDTLKELDIKIEILEELLEEAE